MKYTKNFLCIMLLFSIIEKTIIAEIEIINPNAEILDTLKIKSNTVSNTTEGDTVSNTTEGDTDNENKENDILRKEIKKYLSPAELELLSNPLPGLIDEINSNKKYSENLKKIKKLQLSYLFAFYNILRIKNDIHPTFLLTPTELRELPFSDFQYIENNRGSLKLMCEQATKNYISIIDGLNVFNDSISSDSLKNKEEKSAYAELAALVLKVNEKLSSINSLDKSELISELDLYRLGSTKNMNLSLIENIILPKTSLKESSRKLMRQSNMSKYLKNYIIAADEPLLLKITKNEEDEYFNILEQINNLTFKIYSYQEFLNNTPLNITSFLKYLNEEKIKEENKSKNNTFNELNLLLYNIKKNKLSSPYIESYEAYRTLLERLGNEAQKINTNESMGSITKKELEEKFKYFNLDYKFSFEKFSSTLQIFLLKEKENSFSGKKYTQYSKKQILSVPSDLTKIDKQLDFIHSFCFNPESIIIKNNKVQIDELYENIIKSFKIDYNNIQNSIFSLYKNDSNPLNDYLLSISYLSNLNPEIELGMKASILNISMPLIMSELIRLKTHPILIKHLPDSSKVYRNNEIKNIIIKNLQVLIPNFEEYKGDLEMELGHFKSVGINGKGGKGKTQLVRSIFTEATLAGRFNYTVSAKVTLPENYIYKNNLYMLIKNNGDTEINPKSEDIIMPETNRRLSGSQTNYRKITRTAQLASANHPLQIICALDETTSAVDRHGVANISIDIPEVKTAMAKNQLKLLVIDHNSDSRRKITEMEIGLNIILANNIDSLNKDKNYCISDESFKKISYKQEKNPLIFENIINGKFFGEDNKTSEKFYFKINEKEKILEQITEAEYNRTKAKFSNKVVEYNYIPRLNNPNNPKDKTGCITHDYETNELLFEPLAMLFQAGTDNNEYIAILNIVPEMNDNKIIYKLENPSQQIPIILTKNLVIRHDTITQTLIEDTNRIHSLIENEQPAVLQLIAACSKEEMSALMSKWYEAYIDDMN